MRKLWSYLLVLVMVVCLAGCGSEKETEKAPENKVEEKLDAKTLLEEASGKISGLDAMDMTMDMVMSVNSEGEIAVLKITSSIQGQDINKETMKLKMPMSVNTTLNGEETETMDMMTYYADGYCYMEMSGQKVKQAMELSEIMSNMNNTTSVANIDAEILTDLKLEEKEDLYEISFTCTGENLSAYGKTVMGALSGGDSSIYEDVNITIDNMNGTYYITKDKMISGMSIVMKMSIAQGDEAQTIDVTIDATYNNPGEPVTVELPDFSEYVDATALQ